MSSIPQTTMDILPLVISSTVNRKIRMLINIFSAISLISSIAFAQTPIADGADLQEFALASRPYWKLSQATGHDTCWPSYAIDKSTNNVTSPADLEEWPQADGGGCPDVESSFPVYWNARKCNDSEIRVHYSLFFKKDGFAFGDTELFGHSYDWERIIVIYTKNGSDTEWVRDRALLSQHKGYGEYNWEDLQTSNEDSLDSLGSDNDHPTVFTAWAKHSMYKEKQDKPCSMVDELTDNAFRNDFYKYYNSQEELIPVFNNTDAWNTFASFKKWGAASSVPNKVYEELCSAQAAKDD